MNPAYNDVWVNGVSVARFAFSEKTGWGGASSYNAAMATVNIPLVKGWNTISVMVSLPDELLDAAKVDGCGFFRQYWNIILPLSKASLVTLGLFSFIGSWNNYFGQLIYLTNENLITMPLFIAGLKETHMASTLMGSIKAGSRIRPTPVGDPRPPITPHRQALA